MLHRKLDVTASWAALFPLLLLLPNRPFPLGCSRKLKGLAGARRSSMTGGRVRSWTPPSGLCHCCQYYWWWWCGRSKEQCCCNLQECWDLGCWHCQRRWGCHRLQSCGDFQFFFCLTQGQRRKKSVLRFEMGADWRLGWAWGWRDGWGPDVGWGSRAEVAGRSSPLEAGGGSSCERYGIWFYKTSCSEERKPEEMKGNPSNPNHVFAFATA